MMKYLILAFCGLLHGVGIIIAPSIVGEYYNPRYFVDYSKISSIAIDNFFLGVILCLYLIVAFRKEKLFQFQKDTVFAEGPFFGLFVGIVISLKHGLLIGALVGGMASLGFLTSQILAHFALRHKLN